MALTLQQLEDMRDALKQAIYAGARRVKFEDREVEYHSVSEMDAALKKLDGEIRAAAGTKRSRRRLAFTPRQF